MSVLWSVMRRSTWTVQVCCILPVVMTVPLSSRPLGRVYFDAGGGRVEVEADDTRRDDEGEQVQGGRERKSGRAVVVRCLSMALVVLVGVEDERGATQLMKFARLSLSRSHLTLCCCLH